LPNFAFYGILVGVIFFGGSKLSETKAKRPANTKNTPKPGAKKTTAKAGQNVRPSAKAGRHAPPQREEMKPEIKIEVIAICLFSLAVLLFFGVIISGGLNVFNGNLNRFLVGLFGFGAYLLPFACVVWGISILAKKGAGIRKRRFFMYAALFVILITFIHLASSGGTAAYGYPFGDRAVYSYENASAGTGGIIGFTFTWLLSFLGRAGSFIVLVSAFIILIIILTGRSLFNILGIIFSSSGKKITDAHRNRQSRAAQNRYKEPVAHTKPTLPPQKKQSYDFDYTPGTPDDYVYEQHGKSGLGLPTLTPIDTSYEKYSKRKIVDFIVDDSDLSDDNAEHAVFEIHEPSVDFDENIEEYEEYVDSDEEFTDDNIAVSDDEYDEYYDETPIYAANIDPLFADYAENEEENFEEHIEEYETDDNIGSSINIEGTGIEGYVSKTLTAIGDADFVAASETNEEDQTGHVPQLTAVCKKTVDEVNRPYVLPSVDLLNVNTYVPSTKSKVQIEANARKLEETLKSFGVTATVVAATVGPTVTRYEISPGVGVKVSKISGLADDLALSLAALGIRIEAPVPGKSVVGIEIPNTEVQTVFLRDVVDNDIFHGFPSRIGFAVGKDIAGNSVIVDIAKMPHLLIAGATGAGKSVCINTIIASILLKSTPEEVKMLMIDPKVVELNVYNGIPHLEIPVVTDPHKAAGALSWGVREMNERYNAFAKTGTRDLKGYNDKLAKEGIKPLPQIIIIIDELADLMMSCKADVEQNICRLAQKARAAGIHLIIATQRPSVDVITGLIKANVPSRLAFAVTSGTDSRTILDMVGAEKLLGKGDMLFSPAGLAKPQRIQGAFITDAEVERLVTFIKTENGEAEYDEEKIERITANDKTMDENDFGEDADEHIHEIIAFVTEQGKASISLIQRKFRLGYNRAARIVDMLEDRGIVGPADGTSKPRKVLVGPHA